MTSKKLTLKETREVAKGLGIAKATKPNYKPLLRLFVQDGLHDDEQKATLKRLDYINFSHGSYSLTERGVKEATRLGYLRGREIAGGKSEKAEFTVGIDPGSDEGTAVVVGVRTADGLLIKGVETGPDAVEKAMELATSLSGDDIDDVDEATGVASAKADAYLLWIGAEHYPTIEDFVKEAETMGVSKRMSNPIVCKRVVESGLPVLLAHDEGKRKDCPHCAGKVACPACRKVQGVIDRLQKEIDDALDGKTLEELGPGKKKYVEARGAKLKDLVEQECELCGDAGKIDSGTGGSVVLKNGEKWDYRQYNYWLHQPAQLGRLGLSGLDDKVKDLSEFVEEDNMCKECGGRGELPEGVVFGLFYPSSMEYILKSPLDPAAEDPKLDGFTLVPLSAVAKEAKRGCGTRKAGGVYAIGADLALSPKVAEKLAAAGTELRGPLVKFLAPVSVPYKRCRGVKRVRTEGELNLELEMIKEALDAEKAVA